MVNPPHPSRENYYHVLAGVLPTDSLVVTALGNASYLWSVVRDAAENFYLEDAMGLALPLALGLAVAQPTREIVVVEGDGGFLMHMGGLVPVAAAAPDNLTVLLIDNGMHGASGGQALASQDLDFVGLGRARGLKFSERIETEEELRSALARAFETSGPSFLALATAPDIEVVAPLIWRDPIEIKRRFMEEIGAPRYVPTLFGGGMLGGS